MESPFLKGLGDMFLLFEKNTMRKGMIILVSLNVQYFVKTRDGYKEGDNPFEEKECTVIFKYDEYILEEYIDTSQFVTSYKGEKHVFFELDSFVRQSIVLDDVISEFLKKHHMNDYIDKEDLEDSVTHLVHNQGGGVHWSVPEK